MASGMEMMIASLIKAMGIDKDEALKQFTEVKENVAVFAANSKLTFETVVRMENAQKLYMSNLLENQKQMMEQIHELQISTGPISPAGDAGNDVLQAAFDDQLSMHIVDRTSFCVSNAPSIFNGPVMHSDTETGRPTNT